MKGFLIPAAATALILTGMHTTATAGGGCGMYKGNYHHAVMKYGMHPMHGKTYKMPRNQPADYQYGADAHTDGSGYGNYRKASRSKSAATKKAKPNIVEVASSAGSFNMLITAVKAAGLTETLAGKGPYTVFAPTDDAFAKLPAGTLDALLADKVKLTQILTYHVVPGKLNANAVSGVSTFTTVEGSELPLADIKIAKTDVMASNGIIHVIDEVLIPEA